MPPGSVNTPELHDPETLASMAQRTNAQLVASDRVVEKLRRDVAAMEASISSSSAATTTSVVAPMPLSNANNNTSSGAAGGTRDSLGLRLLRRDLDDALTQQAQLKSRQRF